MSFELDRQSIAAKSDQPTSTGKTDGDANGYAKHLWALEKSAPKRRFPAELSIEMCADVLSWVYSQMGASGRFSGAAYFFRKAAAYPELTANLLRLNGKS